MNGDALDKKIAPLVLILNKIGIITTGSCAGHSSKLAPAPWIKISGSDEKNNREMRRVVAMALADFYSARKVRSDITIVIDDAHFGFWIHNGGSAYTRWRRMVENNAKRIKKGKKPMVYSIRDKEKRRKNLRLYQDEMMRFAEFIKQNFFNQSPKKSTKDSFAEK